MVAFLPYFQVVFLSVSPGHVQTDMGNASGRTVRDLQRLCKMSFIERNRTTLMCGLPGTSVSRACGGEDCEAGRRGHQGHDRTVPEL